MLNTKAHLSPHNPVVQTRVAFTAQRQAAKLSPLGCIFIRLYPLPSSPEKIPPLARRDREQRKKAPDPGAALCSQLQKNVKQKEVSFFISIWDPELMITA